MCLLTEVVMDAEVESVMASSQDQREEELQVSITFYGTNKNQLDQAGRHDSTIPHEHF